jgi:hypothetical protein
MAFTFGSTKTWSDGDTLTAPDLNAAFENIISNATPASIGAQTLDATLTALAALTITQGSLITGTGTDAFSVLAKGTANQHLVTNAGATAPEWATPYFIGTFTRAMDAVGAPTDVAYTGVGFKPKVIIFITSLVVNGTLSVGLDDGTSYFSSYAYDTTPVYGTSATASITAVEASGKTQKAIIKTMDANGFTLTWTRDGATASANATIIYLALR